MITVDGNIVTATKTDLTLLLQRYFNVADFAVFTDIDTNRLHYKARFKRRILHAPNRIAKLNTCKMRRLNQLNAAYFNSMRVSRIFD